MADKTRFYESPAEGARRSAPAASRNREPIAEVLAEWLPKEGTVLEIASGSGEHALFFAKRFPALNWQPSDPDEGALASITAWSAGGPDNLRPAFRLDAASRNDWPLGPVAAILNINMAHISPWAATLGVIDGAARLLSPGGSLIFYGPWLVDGVETAPTNLAFDSDLKRRNAGWGLRHVANLDAAARKAGLELIDMRAMPANNLMLRLTRLSCPA